MTKKDYILVATIMHRWYMNINPDDAEATNTFREHMSHLSEKFADDNSRFNQDKFEGACLWGEGL